MALFCPAGTHYQIFGTPNKGHHAHLGAHQNTLVFIHGMGLDLNLWQEQVKSLGTDYQIITYDLLGHGLSPHAPSDISLHTLAEQLRQLLLHLHLEKVHLIGFSLGGLVARVFATQYHHRLASLTIMSSVFDRSQGLRESILTRLVEVERHGPSANIDQALARWFSPLYTQTHTPYLLQLRAKVLANHALSYSRCYRLFAQGDNAVQDKLKKITCPTLVTTGALDPGSTPAMSHALAAKINSAKVSILPEARHMMPVEKASQVNALIEEFIGAHRL